MQQKRGCLPSRSYQTISGSEVEPGENDDRTEVVRQRCGYV